MHKKSTNKQEILAQPPATQETARQSPSQPCGLKKLKNILTIMGKGLANQHLSESAFTQDDYNPLILPEDQGKSATMEQLANAPLDGIQDASGHKILVIGQDGGFPDALVTHAIGLAQRNKSGIVALHVIPRDNRFLAALGVTIVDQVMVHGEQSATRFRKKCELVGVPFIHLTKVGEKNIVAEEVSNYLKQIAFILVGSDQEKIDMQASVAVHCAATAHDLISHPMKTRG